MANTKISELPAASSVASSDVLPVVVGADTKKATVAVLALAMGITEELGSAAFDDSDDFDAAGAAAAAQAYAIQRANHTGTQSADTLTDGTTNKAFLATERTKLSGIATSATANSSDATLLARANHTGTQAFSTLTMAAGRLIGRSTGGAGIAEEITIGDGILLEDGVLSATGGGSGDVVGPVSSVTGSIAAFDGVTGKLLKETGLVWDGSTLAVQTDWFTVAAGGITAFASAFTVEANGQITSTYGIAIGTAFTVDSVGNVGIAASLNLGSGATISAAGSTFTVDALGNVDASAITCDSVAPANGYTGSVATLADGTFTFTNGVLTAFEGPV